MKDDWRDVKGVENRYEVNSDGVIRTKPYVLKAYPAKNGGHHQVTLGARRRSYVHRIVAETFLPNPENKRLVNHKDGNPANNKLENLEWATHGENNLHAYRSNGRQHPANQKVGAVDSTGEIVMTFKSMALAGKHFNRGTSAIANAVRNGGKSAGFHWIRL